MSVILFCAFVSGVRAENLAEAPLGLRELTEFKEAVALFAPEDYQKSKSRSLLIVIPGISDYSKVILDWMDLAKTKNLVVACAGLVVRDEDVPYKVDEWVLGLRNTLGMRYNIDHVYLIGLGASANYAAYLGLKHPQQFDAVSAVGGTWIGPFEKLTELSSEAENQTPFYIAMNEDDSRVLATQEKVKKMTGKGYQVRLVMLNVKGEENTDGFRSGIIRWFDEQAVKNAELRNKREAQPKTFKQKTAQAVDDFFRV